MNEEKSCPFCGSTEGYYMMETVHRGLFFDYNGEPCGASEDITDYEGKRRYCTHCDRILPKSMFK